MLLFDSKGLALGRIFLGLSTFAYSLQRMLFYSSFLKDPSFDSGVSFFDFLQPSPPELLISCFSVILLLSILLILGKWSRLVCALLFSIWYFIHATNFAYTDRSDAIFSIFYFFGVFLFKNASDSTVLSNIRSERMMRVCFALQISIIYFMAFLFKLNAQWLNGDSLTFVFQNPNMHGPMGEWIHLHEFIPKLLTYSTLIVEITIPILYLANEFFIKSFAFRNLIAFTMISFHLLIGLFMAIPIFSLVCIALWMTQIVFDFSGSSRPVEENDGSWLSLRGTVFASLMALIIGGNAYRFNHSLRKDSPELELQLTNLGFLQKWNMFNFDRKPSYFGIWIRSYVPTNEGQSPTSIDYWSSLNYRYNRFWQTYFGQVVSQKTSSLSLERYICSQFSSAESPIETIIVELVKNNWVQDKKDEEVLVAKMVSCPK